MPVEVRGFHQLQAALAKADKQTRLGVRAGLRQVAKPVQDGAEQLARSEIRKVGPRWSKMRVGITRDLVYVAPRQRGVKNRNPTDPRRRPKFGTLLMEKAMEPALEAHAGEIEGRFEEMLDRIADDFNHGAA